MTSVTQGNFGPPEGFADASPRNPCPICGAKKWCGWNSRIAFCMRESAGSIAEVAYRDGSGRVGYVHPLAPGAASYRQRGAEVPEPAVETAGVEARDAVYRDFLGRLALAPRHRDDLVRRGLSAERIAAGGYRSVPELTMPWTITGPLRNAGHLLEGIPGFFKSPGRNGGSYWTCLKPAGYFIPVRDAAGRIQALQIRRDRADDGGGKYMMFSSSGRPRGANAHTPAHVARPFVLKDCRVWITEGPLKADVASDRLGAVVIGAIGVDGWPQVIPLLGELGIRSVVVAFDADEPGRKAKAKVGGVLVAEGYSVAEASWDPGAKGLDDALAGGMAIRVS